VTQDREEAVRADVWLWRARFFKSRSGASRFVAAGKLRCGDGRVMRRLEKAASVIRPRDVLTFARNERIMCVRVLDLGTRRGPPAEARGLYEDFPPEDA